MVDLKDKLTEIAPDMPWSFQHEFPRQRRVRELAVILAIAGREMPVGEIDAVYLNIGATCPNRVHDYLALGIAHNIILKRKKYYRLNPEIQMNPRDYAQPGACDLLELALKAK